MNRTRRTEEKCFGLFLGIYQQGTAAKTIDILVTALNFLCLLPTVLENTILILTIRKNANLHRPSYVLLGCLAVCDLLTGLFSQPSAIVYGIAKYYENWTATCNATKAMICSIVIFSGISTAMLTAISLDRFLALHYHLRYQEIVTVPRVLMMFAGSWPLFFLVLIPRFLNKIKTFTIILSIGGTASAVIILVCYWKIYKITKKHQNEIQSLEMAMQHANGRTAEQLKAAKKSSFSFFIVTIIYAAFMIPYLVFCVLFVVMNMSGFTIQFGEISFTIIMISASVNPVVYCWRLKELRDAVKHQVKSYFPC